MHLIQEGDTFIGRQSCWGADLINNCTIVIGVVYQELVIISGYDWSTLAAFELDLYARPRHHLEYNLFLFCEEASNLRDL